MTKKLKHPKYREKDKRKEVSEGDLEKNDKILKAMVKVLPPKKRKK